MTNLDYVQYAYDVMGCYPTVKGTKEEFEDFLEHAEDTEGLIIGYILGKGIYTMDDLVEYMALTQEDTTVANFVDKYWDLIDK